MSRYPPHVKVCYLIMKKTLGKSFKEVFHKYVRPASGPFQCWTLHYNGERREDVVHRLKLLLSYVVFDKTFQEVYHFSDKEILYHLLEHYKIINYDDYIHTKYLFIRREDL